MPNYAKMAFDLFEFTRGMRRDLHQYPELGFQEIRTASIIAKELSSLGLEVTTGIAETGVLGLLEGELPGKVLLIRFDMDALPVEEQTGLGFTSKNPGVMHACGHDGHVAVGLTVAKLLTSLKNDIKGTIKFVFQPAEEGLGGAERMIEAGILQNPTVDYSLSMHLWNNLPLGTVGITSGAIMAGADTFKIRIDGQGGHGALPHESHDPLIAAIQIISSLQTIISRNISPLETAVLSICQFNAGETFNVIPQSAEFSGTIRTYHNEVREKVISRFHGIVNGIATSMGCSARVDIQRLTPAVINDKKICELLRMNVSSNFPEIAIDSDYHTMVSEDMAYIMDKAPGCYILVGSKSTGQSYGHHHPKFNIDEDALPIAAATITSAAISILNTEL